MSTITVSTTGTGMASTVTGTGIANNASWTHQIALDPLSLVEPMNMWNDYFKSRGFEGWTDMIAYFDGVAKLSGEQASSLIIKDFTEWRVEVSK